MFRVTEKDLRREVDLLNKKFKKTDKTAVKFAISSAYGGHQIVVKDNRGGGVTEVTYGHKSPREVINDLEKKPMNSLRYTVEKGKTFTSYIRPNPMRDHKSVFSKHKRKLVIGNKNRYWFKKVMKKPYIK